MELKSNIWKMYVVRFLKNVTFFGSVAVPFFLDWARIDYTKIFLLQSVFMLSVFLFEIPTGFIADKYGRKVSIILGGICGSISMMIFGLINNYFMFFIAEAIGALGVTLFSGADKALIYDTLISIKKENEGRIILSRYEAFGTIGSIIGFISGSIVAGSSILPYPKTLPITMIMTGFSVMLSVIAAINLKEPQRKEKPEKNFVREGVEGFKYIFKHKPLRAFAFNFALISATTYFMFWFYQSLAEKVNLSIEVNGFIASGFNLIGIVLLLNIRRIEKWFGIKNILLFSSLIPGLFFLALGFVSNTLFVLIAIVAITSMKIMRAPVLSDFMNKHIASKNRATVLSGVSMLEKTFLTILYPVVGLITDYFSLEYTFMFLGTITVILAFLYQIKAEQLWYLLKSLNWIKFGDFLNYKCYLEIKKKTLYSLKGEFEAMINMFNRLGVLLNEIYQ